MVSNEKLLHIIESTNVHEIIENINDITLEYLKDSDIQKVLTKLAEVNEINGIKAILKNNQMLKLSKGELIDLFSCVCHKRDIELMEMLMERGLNINDKILSSNSENFYTTFLCKAAECNLVELVDFLLKRGVDVNAPDKNGYIPLHKACIGGNLNIVELLVENGSKLNVRNNKGLTPLYYAYKNRAIYTMINDLDLSEGPMVCYLKQHGAELGLNQLNLYETFKSAIYNRNLFILREVANFKADGELSDISFVAKLIVAYDEYERQEDMSFLKKVIQELPKDRKLVIYRKFFEEIGEEFKAEFDKKDTIYKDFIKGDPAFFNVLNTSNQILNREDNVGNSTDKLDLLICGFNNMVSKYYKEQGKAYDDFARAFIKSSNDSLVNIMHNIKNKDVIPNIVKMLNEIRQDKQMFLMTNTRAGNIHNIPQAVFKIKTGPLKGKYALLLVNFGYGYNLSYLGASTVSMYVFSMENDRKVQEIANRIYKIANNFEDAGKSELKIKDFYNKIRELFFEEDKKILSPVYNIRLMDTETINDNERRIIEENKNKQLGITLNFGNKIPRNICNCYVKQQQKILEVMFSILKTCHDNSRRDKSFDIVSFLRKSAIYNGVSVKYTHLDGLMNIYPLQQKAKGKGLETKKFKRELIEEILKIGVCGFKSRNKGNRQISKQEAVAIKSELCNKKGGIGLEMT